MSQSWLAKILMIRRMSATQSDATASSSVPFLPRMKSFRFLFPFCMGQSFLSAASAGRLVTIYDAHMEQLLPPRFAKDRKAPRGYARPWPMR